LQLASTPPRHRARCTHLQTQPGRIQPIDSSQLAAVSNPKALLFFGAFLPQFIDPARSLATQFAVMAATFAAMEFVVEYGLARAAHKVRPFLQRAGRRFNKTCGGMFAAMGIALPGT
ncbi:LysE family translocator, partial [Bordetella pertussis]